MKKKEEEGLHNVGGQCRFMLRGVLSCQEGCECCGRKYISREAGGGVRAGPWWKMKELVTRVLVRERKDGALAWN